MRSRSLGWVLFFSATSACQSAPPTTAGTTSAPSTSSAPAATTVSPSGTASGAPATQNHRIAVGQGFFCAVKKNGKVVCGGSNESGAAKPDQKASPGSVAAPSDVAGIENASGVGAESGHACALVAGEVLCWGKVDPKGAPTTPTKVAGLGRIRALGEAGRCAVDDAGAVACFAGGATMSKVAGVSGAVAVSDRFGEPCALLRDGSVVCWKPGGAPAAVVGVAGARAVASGAGRACAVVGSGKALCWMPGKPAQPSSQLDDLTQIALSDIDYSVGKDGLLWVSGKLGRVAAHAKGGFAPPPNETTAVQMEWTSMGKPTPVREIAIEPSRADQPYETACAINRDGSIACWGDVEPFDATRQLDGRYGKTETFDQMGTSANVDKP